MTGSIDEAARLYAAHDLVGAGRVCLDIVRDSPEHFGALHLLGVISGLLGAQADAVAWLLRATRINPGNAQARVNLGAAYGAVHRFEDAEAAFRGAIALGPPGAGLLNSLGLALAGQQRDQDAIAVFGEALLADPTHAPARFNLGRAHAVLGQFGAAEAAFRWVLAHLPPGTPDERAVGAAAALARALLDQGQAEEALSVTRAAIAAYPDLDPARQAHEALILLCLGRFREGWPAYESRWHSLNHEKPHANFRVLDLSAIAGKRVLVTEEQGRGDVIQFLRYLPRLAALGARVMLRVYRDLLPLARQLPGVETCVATGGDEPEHDVRTSIMSLPLAFGTVLETIPADVPYLTVPAGRAARMKQYLGPASGPRVGLAWSGSAASSGRAAMPAHALAPILRWPGVSFHCLQKDILPDDRAWLARTGQIAIHTGALRDFGDTAALIQSMDLVISIDTAVAHLAGALARPVWIMLAFNPDWRWLLGRGDSPWYPTTRLFRQAGWRDWDSVVARIAATPPF